MNKIPRIYLIIGAIVICLNLIGNLLAFEKIDDEINPKADKSTIELENSQSTEIKNLRNNVIEKLNIREALKRPELYMIAIMFR